MDDLIDGEDIQSKALYYLRKSLNYAYWTKENTEDILKALDILDRTCFGLTYEDAYKKIEALKQDIREGKEL